METPKFEHLMGAAAQRFPLTYPGVVFIGSAALAIRGIRDVRDLDILVPRDLLDRLRMCGQVTGDAVAIKTPHGVLQISDRMTVHGPVESPLGPILADAVRAKATMESYSYVTGGLVRVISLEHLILLKQTRGLTKDFDDIQLIKRYLETGGDAQPEQAQQP